MESSGRDGPRPLGPNFYKEVLFLVLSEYQKEAERTLVRINSDEDRLHLGMGLIGEMGEIVDYFKKVHFQGHTPSREKLVSELGDLLWYTATYCTTCGWNLEEIWNTAAGNPNCDPAFSNSALFELILDIMHALVKFNQRSVRHSNNPRAHKAPSLHFHTFIRGFKRLLWAWRVPVEEAAISNNQKLQKRYPNGFSAEDSMRRSD